jgi:hypothetical protein
MVVPSIISTSAAKKQAFRSSDDIGLEWVEHVNVTIVKHNTRLKSPDHEWKPALETLIDSKTFPATENARGIIRDWRVHADRGISLIDYHLNEISDEIKDASVDVQKTRSAERIENIWNGLDRLCTLAENRLRIGLAGIDKCKPEHEMSSSIATRLDRLISEPEASLAAEKVIETARNLLKSLPAALLGRFDIEIDWIGMGAIEVRLGRCFTWIVYPSRLPWPGVYLRALVYDSDSSKLVKSSNFFLAASAVAFARQVLMNDEK